MDNKNINFISRQLMRSSTKGYLSTEFCKKNKEKVKITHLKKPIPFSSFIMTAFDYDGTPLLLLSELSEHTKNIKDNNIASLMFYEEIKNESFFPTFNYKKIRFRCSYEDPMSRPRLTLLGKLELSSSISHKNRFINRHPASKLYANFADMKMYRFNIIKGHLTGGFAMVKWFEKDDLIYKITTGFEENEFGVMQHMNEEHQMSINLYANKLLNEKKKKNWRITGIDPEGFDIRNGKNFNRLIFQKSLKDSKQLRKEFVLLHKKASNL